MPGVEVTTGPLGQGVANAVGMAMAERFLAEHFNRPGYELVDHHTYAICSDGDMMEGVSQEAASIAGHFGLGKLIVCYDDNRITIDGTTSISFDTENHIARMHADGWHVQRVDDSEDVDALYRALAIARAETERPSFIQVRSHIAYPAPNAVDTAKAHGAPLGEDEVRATKHAMGFDPELKFHVDARVYEHMSLLESGKRFQEEWEGRARAWSERYPQLVEEWERAWSGRLRDGWQDALPSFKAGEEIATRSAGQKTMSTISAYGPTMAGGAADLVESTKTTFAGAGEFSRVHVGRNIPFGIREHAMGAIVNGLAAHGGMVKPYGSTFLVFSDYMRASVRLSALDGAAGAVGVDARFGRPRRGRPHAPAGRALRRAARDPAPVGDAARRRERDRASVEAGAGARGRAGGAVALAPESAGARPRGGGRGRGLGARGVCAVGVGRRRICGRRRIGGRHGQPHWRGSRV